MMHPIIHTLTQIRHFHFLAQSQAGSRMNWHQHANGQVHTTNNHNIVDFKEQFYFENGRIAHDRKRWCWQENNQQLIFSRYRNDDFEPIFIFNWQPESQTWQPQQHYWCAPDEYRATLVQHQQQIELTIYIHSKKKNERLHYVYKHSHSNSE